jgi:magnesium-protoporphyrin IX monomethyl ester (oxidative) cyclase
MKILLIQPCGNYLKKDTGETGAKLAVHPLGLAHIAAVLQAKGHEVQILDALTLGYHNEALLRAFDRREGDEQRHYHIIKYGLSDAKIRSEIEKFNPDVVGVSCLQATRHHEANTVVDLAKEINRDIITVIGGNHPSTIPIRMLKMNPKLDAVIIGEGEYSFAHAMDTSFPDTDGVAWRDGDGLFINPKKNFISNLDRLPSPAWDLLPMDMYSEIGFSPNRRMKGKTFAIFSSSRGCNKRCSYCEQVVCHGNWRPFSAKRTVEEFALLKNEFGIEEVQLEDQQLLWDRTRFLAICEGVKKLNMHWCSPHGLDISLLSEDMLPIMWDSGFYALHLSIEFGSQRILNKLKPSVKVEHTEAIIKKAKEIGFDITAFTMIGSPFETLEDIHSTIDFVKKLDVDAPYFFCSQPMFSTELYDKCKKEGILVDDFDFTNTRYSIANIKSPFFTPIELEDIRRKAWLEIMERKKQESKYDFWKDE